MFRLLALLAVCLWSSAALPVLAAPSAAALGPLRHDPAGLLRAAHGHDPGTAAVAEYLLYREQPARWAARFAAGVPSSGPGYAGYVAAARAGVITSSLAPYEALAGLARGGDAGAVERLAAIAAHSDGEVAEATGDLLATAARAQPRAVLRALGALPTDRRAALFSGSSTWCGGRTFGALPAATPGERDAQARLRRACASPFGQTTVGALVRSTSALAVLPPDGAPSSGLRRVQVRASGTTGLLALAAHPSGAQLADGSWVSVLPLAEGGSGGAFGAIVFAWDGTRPRYAGAVEAPDGRLDAAVRGGAIVVRRPLPGTSAEASCCPSRSNFTRYTVRAGKLVTLSSRIVNGG